GRGVHRIPRDDLLPVAEAADHDDPAVDADPDGEADAPVGFELDIQLVDPRDQVERRATGAVRVVLVRGRDAEDTEHRVADELLDRASMAMQRGLARRVVAELNLAKGLRVEALPERGGPDEVAEEQRHELADLGARRVGREPGAALGAELGRAGIRPPALVA